MNLLVLEGRLIWRCRDCFAHPRGIAPRATSLELNLIAITCKVTGRLARQAGVGRPSAAHHAVHGLCGRRQSVVSRSRQGDKTQHHKSLLFSCQDRPKGADPSVSRRVASVTCPCAVVYVGGNGPTKQHRSVAAQIAPVLTAWEHCANCHQKPRGQPTPIGTVRHSPGDLHSLHLAPTSLSIAGYFVTIDCGIDNSLYMVSR